jgi:hypothetical protein
MADAQPNSIRSRAAETQGIFLALLAVGFGAAGGALHAEIYILCGALAGVMAATRIVAASGRRRPSATIPPWAGVNASSDALRELHLARAMRDLAVNRSELVSERSRAAALLAVRAARRPGPGSSLDFAPRSHEEVLLFKLAHATRRSGSSKLELYRAGYDMRQAAARYRIAVDVLTQALQEPEVAGSEVAGSEVAGSEVAGSEVAGSEVAGSEVAGSEGAGSEGAGSEGAGPERDTKDAARAETRRERTRESGHG